MTAFQPQYGTFCTGFRSGSKWTLLSCRCWCYCLNNLAPSYLSTRLPCVSRSPITLAVVTCARLRHGGDLAVPATRTVRNGYGPRSFAVAGPSMWNSLPVPLRSCHLPSSFRRDLKNELFIRAYRQHARDC